MYKLARWYVYVGVVLMMLLLASQVYGDVVPWVQIDAGIACYNRSEWRDPAEPGILIDAMFGVRIEMKRLVLDPYLGYESLSEDFSRPFEDKFTFGSRLQYGPVWVRLEHFCIHPVVSSYEWDHSGTTYKQSRGRQENRTSLTIGTKLELK